MPVCVCERESVLTSTVMVLLSGVIKPRRPSLRMTAKPSRVTQYSIQQMYTPSSSRDGPPVQTHTGRWCMFSIFPRIQMNGGFPDLERTEGLRRRGLSWGRWPSARWCLSHPSAARGGNRLWCTPVSPHAGSADLRGKKITKRQDLESDKKWQRVNSYWLAVQF